MGYSKVRQIGSDDSGFPILKGDCPVCKKTRLFTNNAYLKAISWTFLVTKIAATTIFGVANPKWWLDSSKKAFSTKAQMKVACEECHHVMWICGKCSMAFSAARYDQTNRCLNCYAENS